MICQLNWCPHFFVVLFLIPFFLKSVVACKSCVIYVRDDDDSSVWAVITRLIWTIWTSLSAVPRKAVKFNHSLTNCRIGENEQPSNGGNHRLLPLLYDLVCKPCAMSFTTWYRPVYCSQDNTTLQSRLREMKLLYRVWGIGSPKCLHPVTYHFLTL